MGEHVIKLPDVGEGVAEAELVEWHVKVGDLVREDAVLAAVMTDKATVEIPSPADGEVLWLGAEIGETVAVGSPIVRLKVAGEGNAAVSGAPVEAKPVKAEIPKPKVQEIPAERAAGQAAETAEAAPKPDESVASCTTTQRPVFFTEATIVSRSSGSSVLRSMTSASMPFSSAAACAT